MKALAPLLVLLLAACGGGGQSTTQSQHDAIDAQIASGALSATMQAATVAFAGVTPSDKKTAQLTVNCSEMDSEGCGGGNLGGNPGGATTGFGMSDRVPTTSYDYNFLFHGVSFGCGWSSFGYVCCNGGSCVKQ